MEDLKDYLKIGVITGTHGLLGEVKVLPFTDFLFQRFSCGKKLYLLHPRLQKPLLLTVEGYKKFKNKVILKFYNYNSIDEVLWFVKGKLVVPLSWELELKEGEFYYRQIIGCQVETLEGKNLGYIKDIIPYPANDIWVVEDGKKEWYLPYISDVVKKVDLSSKKIIIAYLEGLV